MQIENDATRLLMLKSAGAVCVRHDGGQFWAVFDNAFVLVNLETGVESRAPVLTCRTSDVADLPKGTTLQLDAGSFQIKDHQPDGTGISAVVLKR